MSHFVHGFLLGLPVGLLPLFATVLTNRLRQHRSEGGHR